MSTREVNGSVAGKNLIKELQVFGHLEGNPFIAPCRQNQPTPLKMLNSQVIEELLIVRQDAHVKSYPLADLPLQIGFSLEQPEGKNNNKERIFLDQHKKRFYQ